MRTMKKRGARLSASVRFSSNKGVLRRTLFPISEKSNMLRDYDRDVESGEGAAIHDK